MKKFEIIVLVGVFVIVAGCFSIPIIIFAINSQHDTDGSNILKQLHFDINRCDQQLNNTAVKYTYSGNCSQYTGMCSAYNNSTSFTKSLKSNTTDLEMQLIMLSSILKDYSTLVTQECLPVVMPFLCQHVYPPCDGSSVQFLTQKQCVNIRDKVCVLEWRFVMATEFGSLLPVCEAFHSNDSSLTKKDNRLVTPKCHDQFKESCGICLPLCGKFSQYSDQTRVIETVVVIIVAVVALIGGIVVFIAATIRRKEMLKFPQVLTMYTTCSGTILAVVVLITFIGGQETLHCSHEILFLSVQESTPFTQIIGFTIHFCFVHATMTWFLHLFHFFLGVAFPFWSRFLEESKWKNRLHVLEFFGSLVLCSLAPIIFINESEYTFTRFPPLFSLPSKDVTFYTIILPLAIVLAVGINLMIYSLIRIHKSTALFKGEKYYCIINFSLPEVKILLLLSYFIIIGIFSLVNFSISITNLSKFLEDLFRYFVCELSGDSSHCENIRKEFEGHLNPGLNLTSFVLLAFLTWVHLLFAIRLEDVKILMQRIFSYCYMKVNIVSKSS